MFESIKGLYQKIINFFKRIFGFSNKEDIEYSHPTHGNSHQLPEHQKTHDVHKKIINHKKEVSMGNIITTTELLSGISTGKIQNPQFVEATWVKDQPNTCMQKFAQKRIKGAVPFDIEEIRDKNSKYPRMLPNVSEFRQHVSQLGLDPNRPIVIYGQGDKAIENYLGPCRVWWMLKSMGFKNVSVLDGGLAKYEETAKSITIAPQIETTPPSPIQPIDPTTLSDIQLDPRRLATFEDVETSKTKVVDNRPTDQFKEAMIPNSVNVPASKLVGEDGSIIGKTMFNQLTQGNNLPQTISSCGSGVQASVYACVCEHLTGNVVKMYDGSFTEYKDKSKEKVISQPLAAPQV